MPTATIEYNLPAERKALEDAMMGADSMRLLEALRAWLSSEVTRLARAKFGSAEYHYRRGVEACALRFEGLTAGLEHDEGTTALDEHEDESEARENLR